jgi:glucuronoarabinoxylan endo-1,4-beta-xylanase
MLTVRLAVLTVAAAGLSSAAAPVARAAAITVDSGKRHQRIEGFGTCLISWSRPFQQLYRTEKFQKIYVRQVGCNMLRINLWGPVLPKPVSDWREIRWQDFDMSVNGGRAQIFIDFGQGLRKLDPNARFLGTVWSPPAWMKLNGRITDRRSGAVRAHSYGRIDNRVNPAYYKHFAKWLVEMAKLHKAKGVPLYAVSCGNEVQFTQSFESCVWNGKDYAAIVQTVGEMLEAEGLGDVKLFGPETMTSHFYRGGTGDYVRAILDHPGAARQLDVFATHGYEDGFKAEMNASSSRRFWNLIKDTGKPYWMTEGGTGGHDWPQPLHKGIAAAIHNSLAAGNASAFVPWQITEKGKSTHGLMVLDRLTHKTCAAVHFFRFVRPGAVRVDAEPAHGDVKASAYLHERNRTLTVVLINPTKQPQEVSLTWKGPARPAALKTCRTSADEQLKPLAETAVRSGRSALAMPAESMVTLFGPAR